MRGKIKCCFVLLFCGMEYKYKDKNKNRDIKNDGEGDDNHELLINTKRNIL